jgi:DNA-binding transcriptional regulator YhcF (GntR family)
MKWLNQPDKLSITPIYQQIKESVLAALENKKLKIGDHIPSINKICNEFGLAPGTVIRAYEELRELGIISSKQGKGYYISNINFQRRTKVFLLFDRMTAYKEILYDAIINKVNPDIEVEVFFHHYDLKRFEKLIKSNLGKYSYYAIMPHFNQDVSKIIAKIPDKKLIIIDKSVVGLNGKYAAIYQDFESDIYNGLVSQTEQIKTYGQFVFSSSSSPFQFVPDGCLKGFQRFCEENGVHYKMVKNLDPAAIEPATIYLLYSDNELINLLKELEIRDWKPGKDVGIISYDDTPMKEILAGGISVLSTDFKNMGAIVASYINGAPFEQHANPSQFILRKSV